MAEFKDASGDVWRLHVTYHDVARIKRDLGFYLPSLFDGQLESLTRIYGDLELLASVLASLCESQMDDRGMSAEDFARRLGGDVLADAANAVVEATIDFFPEAHRRESMRAAWGKMIRADRILRDSMSRKAAEAMERAMVEISSSD